MMISENMHKEAAIDSIIVGLIIGVNEINHTIASTHKRGLLWLTQSVENIKFS